MLESAVQARAATEQQPTPASGNLATAFKAVHTRITGTCNCKFWNVNSETFKLFKNYSVAYCLLVRSWCNAR
jgi:hypothetical protein